MKLDQKGKLVALNLLGKLTGQAWDACEELVDKLSSLEDEKTAFDTLMAALDKRFELSKFTKLPEAFEEYFYKGNRKPKEPLNEFIQRQTRLARKIKDYNVELPELVQGWLLLRRAQLTPDQKSLVMSNIKGILNFTKIEETLTTLFGQSSFPKVIVT